MAAISYFLIGPSLVLSLAGLIRGQRKSPPKPSEDWRQAKVDVIIPAHNEQATIDLCLASLSHQTFKPRKIILIDDGSTDNTAQYAKEFSESIGLDIEIIRREKSVGKTTSVRYGAFESGADIEFVLDSDTILTSDNYIARIVETLYSDAKIASACGAVLPLTETERNRFLAHPTMSKPLQEHSTKYPEISYHKINTVFQRALRCVTNAYRDVLYKYLQKIVFPGQLALAGTMINPVGCAVGYRTEYLRNVFTHADATIGPNLTTSEDIYFGFAFNDQGYRNVQVRDVQARTLEPLVTRLPKQILLWSSAFYQSIYFTGSLIKSPLKLFKNKKSELGRDYTQQFGRSIGWFILFSAIEKIVFPIAFISMLALRMWEALAFTVALESLMTASFLLFTCKDERLKMFLKSILVTPVRYMVLIYDLVIFIWFLIEISLKRDKEWKK